jgi:hypothetical protein
MCNSSQILACVNKDAPSLVDGGAPDIDVLTAEQEAIPEQWGMAQAYQVIGALAYATGTFETPEVQAALDYFCKLKYRDDWPIWIAPSRENEFDTGTPGEPRPMTGIWPRLTDEQKAKVLAYQGDEYGGAKPDNNPDKVAGGDA